KRAPKVYGFDTGFVCVLNGWSIKRPDDAGRLWEHYVLNELHSKAGIGSIHHWRTTKGHEVDFVLAPRGRPPIAIECKWSVDGREDLRGLKAFRRAYPDGESFVVAPNADPAFERGLTGSAKVSFVTLANLMALLPASP
ncbi:MAG: DUF4143 domain-containing protein, partial [Actinomycetota bacterium]